jgi:hypothetical protein
MEKTNNISMEHNMDSSRYTPRLGFWVATTFVIIVTVFPIIFLGAFPGNEGERANALLRTVGVALIPGICVGLLQASIMAYPLRLIQLQWFVTTVVAVAIGWGAVSALSPLLTQLRQSSPISDQLVLATIDGFLTGGSLGAIVGLVTGIAQGWIQRLSMRQWIIGNLISWSVGVGVSFAMIFAAASQISFF